MTIAKIINAKLYIMYIWVDWNALAAQKPLGSSPSWSISAKNVQNSSAYDQNAANNVNAPDFLKNAREINQLKDDDGKRVTL